VCQKCPSKNNSRESILSGSLKNYEITIYKHTKLKIYTSIIKPPIIYGWYTPTKTEQMNGWRIQTNDKLQIMQRNPNIVTPIGRTAE